MTSSDLDEVALVLSEQTGPGVSASRAGHLLQQPGVQSAVDGARSHSQAERLQITRMYHIRHSNPIQYKQQVQYAYFYGVVY